MSKKGKPWSAPFITPQTSFLKKNGNYYSTRKNTKCQRPLSEPPSLAHIKIKTIHLIPLLTLMSGDAGHRSTKVRRKQSIRIIFCYENISGLSRLRFPRFPFDCRHAILIRPLLGTRRLNLIFVFPHRSRFF